MSVGAASREAATTIAGFPYTSDPAAAAGYPVGSARPFYGAWWTFTLDVGRDVQIDAFATTGTDPDTIIEVYNGTTQVARNDDVSTRSDYLSGLTASLPAGTYHVLLGCYSSADDTSYVLHVDANPVHLGPVVGGGSDQWVEFRRITNDLVADWVGDGPAFDPFNEPPGTTGGTRWVRGTYAAQPASFTFPRATGAVVDHALAESTPFEDGALQAIIMRQQSASGDASSIEFIPTVGQLGVYGMTDPDRYIPLSESDWPDGAIGIQKVTDTVITSVLIEVKVTNVNSVSFPWYPSTVVAVEAERPALPADGFPISLQTEPQTVLPTGSWTTLDTLVDDELPVARYYQFIIDWLLAAADQTELGIWASRIEVRTTYDVTFGQYRFVYEGEAPPTESAPLLFVTPPLRMLPRSDSLGVPSARRVAGSRTIQGSLRRAGGTTF